MKNTFTRFTAGAAVLTIYMRQGKLGVNVAASLKKPAAAGDEKAPKAITGGHETFKDEDFENVTLRDAAANLAYLALQEQAMTNGWTPKVKPPKKERVKKNVGFTTIPPATDFADAAAITKDLEADTPDEKPVDEKPVEEKKTSKKAKK